jgi:aquaporin TIP
VAAVGYFQDASAAALVVIAIAHGLGILIAVAWTANISGGHINPAVTLGMLITKNIRVPLGIAYMVAQFAGAALGSLLLKLVTPKILEGDAGGNLGLHSINRGITSGEGLLMEIICTAFLVWVIFNTAVSVKGWANNAPIAIGLAVMAIHFAAVPVTGASVNPARSFGPALITNDWADFWVYLVGPFAGGAIAALGWLAFKVLGDDLEPAPAVVEPGYGAQPPAAT